MKVNPAKPAPLYQEKPFLQRLATDFQKHKYKYLLILPIIIYLILFCYKPMYGLVIAFKNYRPTRGIMDSKWVGFMWFETFFKDPYFWRLLRNTFSISGLTILFGFPAPHSAGAAAERSAQRQVQAHRADHHLHALLHLSGGYLLSDQDLHHGERSVPRDHVALWFTKTKPACQHQVFLPDLRAV